MTPTTQLRKEQNCECCGQRVRVEGTTTMSYVGVDAEELAKLSKPVKDGPLAPDNIDQQFCSDWLKDEIRRVFAERDAANAKLAEAREVIDGESC